MCRRSMAGEPEDSRRDRSPAAYSGCAARASSRRAAGDRGDLFCRVTVETPVKLSTEQRELLQKFEESLRQDGNQARAAAEEFHRRREALLRGCAVKRTAGSSTPVRVVILGAPGRMGVSLLRLLPNFPA
jgi:hypothetical protein